MIGAAFAAAVIVATWLLGDGPGGWIYIGLYALAVAPGLPIGWRLFGRTHAAGWIAGTALGYAIACFIAWLAAPAAGYFRIALIAMWLAAAVIAFMLGRRERATLIDLGPWKRSDSAALMCLLILTLVIAAVPLRRVGERDADGNRRYRAYFTADFLWHMAMTSELTSGDMPPRNPYLASQRIHYYWTYFLVPAAIARGGPPVVQNVEICLKVNALASGLLFVSAVFLGAFAAVRRAGAAAIAATVALAASSAEGAYELYRRWYRGVPWTDVGGLNIDALTAWYFQGHRIDGLQRCLWYVPQHAVAYALGLIALATVAAGIELSTGAILIGGIALGGSVAMNPLVGAVFATGWGCCVLIDTVTRRRPIASVARYLLAAVPVGVALAWCVSNAMVEGAGGNLAFGWAEASRRTPLFNLMLSLGPALVPACAGLILAATQRRVRPLLPALIIGSISLMLMHSVWLTVDKAWLPFRAGQMLLAVSPVMIAMLIAEARNALKPLAIVLIVAALIAGLPTTLIDTYNAQDIYERRAGAGFAWTLVVSPDEQAAAAWIRTATPKDAIVQMEPTIRDRDLSPHGWGEWWSFIPSLGERRMAAGLPISLMRVPAYGERAARVKAIFETPDKQQAWQLARSMRIDYLYVDGRDLNVYPEASRFATEPQRFEPVFQRRDVTIFRIK